MKSNCFTALMAGLFLLLADIFNPDLVYSERPVTVATIGNTPALTDNDNLQATVDYVISFWEKELKKVLKARPDLIVLPEFADLSIAGVEYMKVRGNQVLDFFSSVARENKCYIAFGMGRQDSMGLWRNSCMVLNRKGAIAGIYDKNYPTISEIQTGIRASDDIAVIDCDFGKVGVAICFDLNFDELLAKYSSTETDIIIYPSMSHGGVLQNLWALSCNSYFIGSIYRDFPSEVRNPLGKVIATTSKAADYAIANINLDYKTVSLANNLEKLVALKSKYGNTVQISETSRNGRVIVTSSNKSVSSEQMIREFNIEPFNEYLDRARSIRTEDMPAD
ncbi:MAG TPA: carbon-nitrogen hydrolase family protein [Bacteroidales bacterium]|nr:carbon-nitrogen hydrolase family protein [Bacteroidales bacterium]HNR40691.1 carbon-nitrogen hydrolase family protein [Bacteroidales bacterium]HPM17739.1 carbon-nitrogen hydrolase family protein [Bacteroidales bacterium]HQG77785.1 carbon-nitrogen hydrolase family protein [Bacteroidales bacterium]